MVTTIIYGLVSDNLVHYVGLTDRKPGESQRQCVQDRLRQHWQSRHRKETAKTRWLRTLNRPPQWIILAEVSDFQAQDAERTWITSALSWGWPLTNTLHNPAPYEADQKKRVQRRRPRRTRRTRWLKRLYQLVVG